MTEPVLTNAALVKMLRTLANRVESSADLFEVGMETEGIGHATKTTITLWALKRPAQHAAELAARMVTPWRLEGGVPVPVGQNRAQYVNPERHVVGNGQTWCSAWRADVAPARRCNTFLHTDGTCPNAERHLR